MAEMRTRAVASTSGRVLLLLLALGLSGCAAYHAGPDGETLDPLEPVNRPIFKFNRFFDRWILRPVTKGYDTVMPKGVKYGVSNFFVNWEAPIYVVNHVLQGQPGAALRQTGRFAINTTLGIGGIIDAATDAKLPAEPTGFGITLGKWGVKDGPYLMLPFLGPSNPRDALGMWADLQIDPIYNYKDASIRDKLLILRIIDTRRKLLGTDKAVNEAPDPYIFVREAYLQNRRYKIKGEEAEDNLDDFEAEFEEMLEEDSGSGGGQ